MDNNLSQPIQTPPVEPVATDSFFKRYWIQLTLLITVLVIIVLVIALVITRKKTVDTNDFSSLPTPTSVSTPVTPTIALQQPFHILTTSPKDKATNVFAGELVISLTTDMPIVASSSLNLEFTPKLKYYTKYINAFPTKTVQLQVLGGLAPNTTYVVVAKDKKGITLTNWSFTTSSNQGEAHSALNSQLDQQTFAQYYPLEKYLPYSTNDYRLGYVDHFKLKISLKRTGLNQSTVLTEVKSWVKSKGVEPESHTYVFSE